MREDAAWLFTRCPESVRSEDGNGKSVRIAFARHAIPNYMRAMAGVRVTFLGTGDAFGSGGRLQTCFLLEPEEDKVLIDCGTSALIGLKRQGIQPGAIRTILISHLHGDHFGGIPFFMLDAHFTKRQAPLVLAGPPGMRQRVREAFEALFPRSSGTTWSYPVTFYELDAESPAQIGSVVVRAYPVIHESGAAAYALRVECGERVVAYSGDTEWTDQLITAAEGVDLFICEAYTHSRRAKYHLDYYTVLANRAALGCKRIVLTHMGPEMLSHVDDSELETAKDGAIIQL